MKNKSLNKEYYIFSNTEFDIAIRKMNLNKIGFLAVLKSNFQLIGILTDSDLRNAFLEKKTELMEIINKNPITMNYRESRHNIVSKLRNLYLRHMPVVDDNNILIDVVVLANEERMFKKNKVVIMAGGIGSRLGSLTENMPKPMLNIGNRPILEHIIYNCKSYGFSKFVISVNYKQEVIKNYFKDGSQFGIDITYIEEKKKLGTAGALSLIKNIEDDFLLLNADVITSLNLDKLITYHLKLKSLITIAVKNSKLTIPYGVIQKDKKGNYINIEEKPVLDYQINAGIYIISPKILNLLNKNVYCDINHLINKVKNKDINIYEFEDFWIDVGTKDNYQEINNKFLNVPDLLQI